MAKKPQYNEQYCKKHKFHYAGFLHECPICRGEKMDGIHKVTIEFKKVKK